MREEADVSEGGGFEAIASEIAAQTGEECAPEPQSGVSGGSIHRSYRWHCGGKPLFVKVAAHGGITGLEAEASGLIALAGAHAVRVPRVMARGIAGDSAFLALEWIESRPAGRPEERRLGEQLAAQHRVTAPQFGFASDNFIGRTPQPNGCLPDWVEFFRERRLRHQLALAAQNGFASLLEEHGARLLESVAALLAGHRPQAALLHGDLWAGNWLADEQEEPVIFDPAVYYGDREADLAMTRLFGGFGRAFYDEYQTAAPLPAGHALRAELYNLYHVLNHANLFGGGYARQARASIDRLLAEVRG
ncbi:MAG TPA: fructosamine kinase family protein [Steroidobacteraceae bacterium]|jgi:fructosamine-3-kinase|nr:fructosamine kinase family protein [Steroidobacteraceae bacterium]